MKELRAPDSSPESDEELEVVLDAFAAEPTPSRETLELYLLAYPQFAEDLVGLSRELAREAQAIAPLSAEESALIDAAYQRHADAGGAPTNEALAEECLGLFCLHWDGKSAAVTASVGLDGVEDRSRIVSQAAKQFYLRRGTNWVKWLGYSEEAGFDLVKISMLEAVDWAQENFPGDAPKVAAIGRDAEPSAERDPAPGWLAKAVDWLNEVKKDLRQEVVDSVSGMLADLVNALPPHPAEAEEPAPTAQESAPIDAPTEPRTPFRAMLEDLRDGSLELPPWPSLKGEPPRTDFQESMDELRARATGVGRATLAEILGPSSPRSNAKDAAISILAAVAILEVLGNTKRMPQAFESAAAARDRDCGEAEEKARESLAAAIDVVRVELLRRAIPPTDDPEHPEPSDFDLAVEFKALMIKVSTLMCEHDDARDTARNAERDALAECHSEIFHSLAAFRLRIDKRSASGD